jgi:DNA-binding GntR family transcriptional regulator
MTSAHQVLQVARSNETLRTRVQDLIRASILDGYFEPGEKLIERELCEMTGVSRTILREALAHLEASGLIESHPHRGVTVAVVSVDTVREIYEVRAALEALAARCCAERATDRHVAALKDAARRLSAALKEADLTAIRIAKTDFYDVLFEGAGNRELKRVLDGMLDRISNLRGYSMSQPGRREACLREIREMTEAIASRDGTRAERASRAHVAAAEKAVLQRIRAIHAGKA